MSTAVDQPGDWATRTSPAVAAGFRWDRTAAGDVLRCEALEGEAPHLFTSRNLAFRGDAEADYERVAALFSVPTPQVIRVVQVHGDGVLVVRSRETPLQRQPADAIVCAQPGLVASVRVADCVPILLAGGSAGVVAAVHAGWRGTAAGVVGAAVREMQRCGVRPADIVAAIGPSIGPCCYQVDGPVRDACLAAWPEAERWFADDSPSRWRLDLWQANTSQLIGAGLRPEQIHVARLCTAHNLSLCYSFRREGADAGRMVAAIGLPELDRASGAGASSEREGRKRRPSGGDR